MNTHTLRIPSLLAVSFSALSVAAQTTPAAKPPVHRPTATATAAHRPVSACGKHPELSPKVPALPAGTCIKTMYTLSTSATHLDPQMNPKLREALEKINQNFSLEYADLKIGTGPLAEQQKWYTVHYTGYLADGTVFDSSVERKEPFTFPYGAHRVIQGWDTGFEGMHIGGKRRLYIPYQIAYGEAGRPPKIPAKSELIFDMELISQSDQAPAPPTPPAPAPKPSETKPVTPPAPAPSPAGTAAPPPTTSTTPLSSTAPSTPPAAKPQ